MSHIRIHDKNFIPYISKEAISARIAEIGAEMNGEYAGKNPLFIAVLTGSFIFAADLLRAITIPCEVTFVKLSSYDGLHSTGNVVKQIRLSQDIADRHVIVLEDIIDTGKTLHSFLPELLALKPASLKLACLLSKPDALQYDVTTHYTGFVIPDNFVVGYGLDYDGEGRNLPDIYTLAV